MYNVTNSSYLMILEYNICFTRTFYIYFKLITVDLQKRGEKTFIFLNVI